MIRYPMTDINGTIIGTVVLENDDVPNLIMNDVKVLLGGSSNPIDKTFLSFILVPLPIKERHGISRSSV